MTLEELQQIESSQRQHFELLQHQEKMTSIVQQTEFNLFKMLQPSIQKDGNQWCVLYGDNLHDGIAGFGDTPYKAILDFNAQWHKF